MHMPTPAMPQRSNPATPGASSRFLAGALIATRSCYVVAE
jgi:hypothetical protein